MLKVLDIENIAIIEKASVEFSSGLNILTGETGAGKSIIIDSINAVTGEKASRELIRTGENKAVVSALFDGVSEKVNEKLRAVGVEPEPDGSLLLNRSIGKDGKNTCRINGTPVTVSMLRNVGEELINIHGQRDSQALLDSARHIGFLDGFAGLSEQLEAYRADFARLKEIAKKIASLQTDEAEKARRIDLLTYQIRELEDAEIRVGEREELHRRKNILNNSKKLSSALTSALRMLSGDGETGGASSLVSEAASQIEAVSSCAKGLDALSDTLENTANEIADAACVIDDVLSQLHSTEEDLDAIDERLDLLYRLSKKYGSTEQEMTDFLDSAKKELEEINLSDELVEQLSAEYTALYDTTEAQAKELSRLRKRHAKKLSEVIEAELSFLNMPSCRFFVGITECDLCRNGTDAVEFRISANTGEEAKPLGKVASGGELSRIMLAMKNVLSSSDGADTLIFDEIDAGVSGSAAGKIAVKLSDVSASTQVLCITHLSQIAAYADEHLFIRKEARDGKTFTVIRPLSREERAAELARISFGDHVTEEQLGSSMQLIEEADGRKKRDRRG